jgi:hypothetical protein
MSLRDMTAFADRRLDEIGYAGGWVLLVIVYLTLGVWAGAQ